MHQTIESVGSQVLGEAVTVEEVQIELRNGVGQISGLQVKNPSKYVDSNIFQMDLIRLNLDTSTLKSSPLVLDELIIESPVIVAEVQEDGSVNLRDLISNVKANTPKETPATDARESSEASKPEAPVATEEAPEQKKIAFRKIRIVGVTVKLRYPGHEDVPRQVVLPEIELENVGGTEGVTPAGKVITEAIAEAALKESAKEKIAQEGDKLKVKAEKAASGLIKDLGSRFRGEE